MALAVVTLKIMPDGTDTDLTKVQVEVEKLVREFAGKGDTRISIEPIAFGLKCLVFTFIMDEKLGSPDVVCEKINEVEGVQNSEVTDVRRAIG